MVYAWRVQGGTSEWITEFDTMLNKAPDSAPSETIADLPEWQNAGADFLAQMAARGGAGRVSSDGIRNVETAAEVVT